MLKEKDGEANLVSDIKEEVEEEDEEKDSSSTTSFSHRDKVPTLAGLKRKKKNTKQSANIAAKQQKVSYRFSGYWKEDHGQPVYGVSINPHIQSSSESTVFFATVGYNRVTIYEGASEGGVRLVQCYADPDSEENFYTCAWSYDPETKRPVLAAAGSRGIIRLFSTATMTCVRNFVGHGNAVNELKFHPKDPNLLLSVSRDHALRVWNVKTEANIVIFGGVEGHRDEVLSADFDMLGDKIISCGMDHSLKIWNFGDQKIQDAVQVSYKVCDVKSSFKTVLVHFPVFSTRDIHSNYVDSCRWFGDFVLSKSCENCIVCWKPGQLEESRSETRGDDGCSIIHKLQLKDCDIWFIRFSMDGLGTTLALGNRTGKVYVWDLDVQDPGDIRSSVLTHPKCNSTIRQTSMSQDGSMIVAVCDDGTVWRWDKNN